MPKPKGLSFYKRIALGKYLSVNPSTNGVSVSIGVPGARVVVPIISFGEERAPMVNLQKYGIRYRRHFVDVGSLLDEAHALADSDPPAAAKLYRKAEQYARTPEEEAQVMLGKGYIGKRQYRSIDEIVEPSTPQDFYKLGATMRGDYERFLETIGALKKKR